LNPRTFAWKTRAMGSGARNYTGLQIRAPDCPELRKDRIPSKGCHNAPINILQSVVTTPKSNQKEKE
jgi:hypothetical protein